MAIIGKLRERSGLVIILIGLAMLGFIASDLLTRQSALFKSGPKGIGEIFGEQLDEKKFQEEYQNILINRRRQSADAVITPEIEGQANDQAWEVIVSERIIEEEAGKLGLDVSANEIMDLCLGPNPHPLATSYLSDPKTGQIDKAQLYQFLSNIGQKSPEQQKQWVDFERFLTAQRLKEKVMGMVKAGMFVTDLEAKADFDARNKTASIQYVPLFTSSIKDSDVNITDAEVKAYYESHKEDYKREQSRTFEYVVFGFTATKQDTMDAEKWVSSKIDAFRNTKNDSVYVTRVGLSNFSNKYLPRGSYPENLENQIFSADSGTVIGPIYEDGKYKIIKVMGSKQDSVYSMRASHILIRPGGTTAKDTAEAMNKANDLLKKIRGGANFADVARESSQDPSASKGGDLGWFREGAMVKPFNDAVKNGQKGDLVIVKSQFGAHIIKITEDKTKKLVKAGIIERAVQPGKATENEAFEKANKFYSDATKEGDEQFSKTAKKLNISPRIAENIVSTARDLPVLGNAREVIRWAYKPETNVGDVSGPMPVGDNYVVAHLTKSFEEGYAPFDDIKDQVKVFAIAEKKKDMLAEKLSNAKKSGKTLEDMANAVKSSVSNADNITFNNPFIPNLNSEPSLAGAAFGLTPNKIAGPVKGENGVYLVKLVSISGPNPPAKMDSDRKTMAQQERAAAEGTALDALRKMADVKDYRYLYY
jgi:peptidyl-prolyl cis-trans isomerase D